MVGSIPVVGSSSRTMGGLPTRAMAVLSLRLLPPLQLSIEVCNSRHTHRERERGGEGGEYNVPVCATLLVGVLLQVESCDLYFDHLLDLPLWDASESGKHGEQLPPSQTLNEGIKLRTVANPLLNLEKKFKISIILIISNFLTHIS